MRNEDVEEKAYKRFRRHQRKEKDKQSKVKDMLKLQSSRCVLYTLKLPGSKI